MITKLEYYKKIPGTLLLLHAILSILVHLLWISVTGGNFLATNNEVLNYVISSLIMQGVCILIPSIFVIWYFKTPFDTVIGDYDRSSGGLFLSAIIGVPAAVVFIGINNGVVYIMSSYGISIRSSLLTTGLNYNGTKGLILSILIAVLLPGIIEEIMFRGVILGSMLNIGKPFWAILFSAIAFSVFHVNPIFIIAPFMAGLLLGFIRYKSGNLFASVLTHITMNLTILLISPILPRLSTEYFELLPQNNILYASLLSALIASVALIPLIIVFASSKTKSKLKIKKATIFPFDYKFLIGIIVLILTIFFVYFNL